jgi:hypothetical protein
LLTITSLVSLYANPVKWVKQHILMNTHKTTCFSPSFCFSSFDSDELLLLPFPVRVVEVSLAVRFVLVFASEVEFSSIRWFTPNSRF